MPEFIQIEWVFILQYFFFLSSTTPIGEKIQFLKTVDLIESKYLIHFILCDISMF